MWACACLLALAAQTITAGELTTVEQAEFVVDASSTIPVGATWSPEPLTERWPLERYDLGNQGWYRIFVDLPARPDQPIGIFMRRLNMNAEIYMNGELIWSGGSFADPISRNWNYPVFAAPSRVLWREGRNEIHIRHTSYRGYGYLSPLFIGDAELLRDEYDTYLALQVGVAEFLFPVTVAIAILIFATWLRRRRETTYLWFSLAIASWSVYISNMFVKDIVVSAKVWEWIAHFSVDLWVILFCTFAVRFTGRSMGVLARVYVGYLVLVGVVYAALDLAVLRGIFQVAHAVSMAFGAHMIAILYYDWWHKRDTTMLISAVGLTLMLATGINDWMFQFGVTGVTGTFSLHLHYYAAPLVFAFIAWHLTSRFAVALGEVEDLNSTLESRIDAAEHELEERYERINAMQQEQAILHERERISREIHDGIGGSFSNAIMLTELISRTGRDGERIPRLQNVLSDGLAEVRHLISAMAGDMGSTSRVASYVSDKARTALEPLGVEFSSSIGTDQELTNAEGLNLARIFTEAINNSAKYAEAAHVTFDVADSGAVFTYGDDGVGFDTSDAKVGYGLANMQKRCEEIGASIRIQSAPGAGTQIEVSLGSDSGRQSDGLCP